MTDADPVNPMRIFHELSQRLPSNAIVSACSGSSANWYARHLKFPAGVRGSLSGTLATMGPAVPYVIGAKWAHPDRPGIAFVGDGAMQMNNMAELITVAKYWQQWTDPRLIVAVLHNNDLNQVTWEMRAMGDSPKFVASQSLPDVDYAAFARSLGLHGENIDDSGAAGRGLGPGAGRRSSHGARRALRPRRPADPAARHLRAGQVARRGGAQGRRRRSGLRQAGPETESPAIPSGREREVTAIHVCSAEAVGRCQHRRTHVAFHHAQRRVAEIGVDMCHRVGRHASPRKWRT